MTKSALSDTKVLMSMMMSLQNELYLGIESTFLNEFQSWWFNSADTAVLNRFRLKFIPDFQFQVESSWTETCRGEPHSPNLQSDHPSIMNFLRVPPQTHAASNSAVSEAQRHVGQNQICSRINASRQWWYTRTCSWYSVATQNRVSPDTSWSIKE